MSQKEMFTIAKELFKQLTAHLKGECSEDCCVKRLLRNLELEKE
jgi:hypothetical protein